MYDNGVVMAGIAIAQSSGRQVEDAEEEGDEHIRGVGTTEFLIHLFHDEGRICLM